MSSSQNPVPIDQGAAAEVFPLDVISPPFRQRDRPRRVAQLGVLAPYDLGEISVSPHQPVPVSAAGTWRANLKGNVICI